MSIDSWMDNEDVVPIYNGLLRSHQKEWNNAIHSNMDGIENYHTKWSKSERERQTSYDVAYRWNGKNMIPVNLFIKQKQTHRLRKQLMVTMGGRGRGDRKFGLDMYTLLSLK